MTLGLLEVAIDLDAVVARIGYDNVIIDVDGQALGPVERLGRGVDEGEEGTLAVEHL